MEQNPDTLKCFDIKSIYQLEKLSHRIDQELTKAFDDKAEAVALTMLKSSVLGRLLSLYVVKRNLISFSYVHIARTPEYFTRLFTFLALKLIALCVAITQTLQDKPTTTPRELTKPLIFNMVSALTCKPLIKLYKT